MDINDLRALSTVLMFLAFVGILIWAFSGRRDRFEDAANLPFADDDDQPSPQTDTEKRS